MQIEVLSAVVSSVVNSVGAPTVVDVGSGQVSSNPFSCLLINLNCIAKFSFWLFKEFFD